jgi:hypothetical protein
MRVTSITDRSLIAIVPVRECKMPTRIGGPLGGAAATPVPAVDESRSLLVHQVATAATNRQRAPPATAHRRHGEAGRLGGADGGGPRAVAITRAGMTPGPLVVDVGKSNGGVGGGGGGGGGRVVALPKAIVLVCAPEASCPSIA